MNDPKETQQELFQEFSTTPKKTERFPMVSRTQKPILFSTNTEQLLMAGILFILTLCGVFFLGVMRGKVLAGLTSGPVILNTAPVPAPIVSAQPSVVRPAPAAPMPVATQIPTKPYTLTLVTHRKKEMAEAEMNAIRGQGFYSFVRKSGDYFEVCVGQYASRDEAKRDLARFSHKYKDCFLRRV